jgi:pimeloyl-ACP methyl ester carboxylesterase
MSSRQHPADQLDPPDHPRVRDGMIRLRHRTFHFREWGSTSATSVVLLHGLTSHARAWDRVAAALATRFHVVSIDQRGHGESDWADNYAPNVMAEDIAELLPALGIERARVVGSSMGGIIAYLCAARYPDLFEQLVIVNVGPNTRESLWVRESFMPKLAAWAEAAFADPEEAVAAYLRETPHLASDLRGWALDNVVQRTDGVWVWRFDAEGLRSFLAGPPPASEQWDALRAVRCPTLVIRLAGSRMLDAETARRMVDLLPRGSLVEMGGNGLEIHVEGFAPFVATLERFLDGSLPQPEPDAKMWEHAAVIGETDCDEFRRIP